MNEWSDADVARRWLMLCPERRDEKRRPLEPTEFEVNSIVNNKEKLDTVRSRLSDLSWWMRLLSQNIAQRANKEDGEVGKFFQARYRAVRLLDETSILASAAYVDLNPIRAAMAKTIEDSDFTSAQKRLSVLSSRLSENAENCVDPARDDIRSSALPEQIPSAERRVYGTRAGVSRPEHRSGNSVRHLAPVEQKERGDKTGQCLHKAGVRCSNKGFLPISTVEYLTLLQEVQG